MLGMEVPGSNSGKFFDIFVHPIHPAVNAPLEYLEPAILHLFGFYCFITL